MAGELWEHQETAIEKLRDGIRADFSRQVLQLPTGGGKTKIAAHMTKSALAKGRRIFFLADRIELIDQTSARFDSEGIQHGVIQGDHWRWQPHQAVQVATIQTLVNRKFDWPDLMFVDECHGGGKRLNDFVTEAAAAGVVCIGLSATPFTRGMGKTWERLVVVASTADLIKKGILVPPVVYAPTEPDLTGVKVVAGEWEENALAAAVDTPTIVGDIVQTWLTKGEERQTIVFAVNIAHSRHIVEQFRMVGVEAAHIDAYTNATEREMLIKAFRRGDIKLLSNVGILDRGFDVPETGCIIYARPIKSSLSLYIQMGGRGLRMAPGKKDCIILDHAGNTLRHGFLTDPLPEELDDGKPVKKTAKKKIQELKKCPSCSFVKPRGVHKCPQCGFAPAVVNEVFCEAGELKRMQKTEDRRLVYQEIMYIKNAKGYSDGWAAHQYRKMTGSWPPRAWNALPPIPPSDWTARRIKQMMIAYFKAKAKEGSRVAA